MMHTLLAGYLTGLGRWGLAGVALLMAMESSILPVPSELVIPPAAFWASQSLHNSLLALASVVIAGTVGSTLGSVTVYWGVRALGRPAIWRYGKYVGISPLKLSHAERWVAQYGAAGIFLSRLLPVARQIVAIPAGLMGLRFRTFLFMTLAGSALWCLVLALFGLSLAADMAILVRQHGGNLAVYQQAFRHLLLATGGIAGMATITYVLLGHRCRPAVAREKNKCDRL